MKFEAFQITLDGPKALHDEVKSQKGCSSAFCQTLENVEYMLNHSSDIFVVLRINYTHNNLDEIIVQQINEIISPKNRSHITISPKKVWQEHADMSISKDVNRVLNIFETSGYKVKKLDIVSTFMSCYTDKKYYNCINYNGNVVKCTASNNLHVSERAPGCLNEDGTISWKDGFEESFFKKRFEDIHCIECKHLPMCMGLCHNAYNPNGKFYCKMEREAISIEESIINYIDYKYGEDNLH